MIFANLNLFLNYFCADLELNGSLRYKSGQFEIVILQYWNQGLTDNSAGPRSKIVCWKVLAAVEKWKSCPTSNFLDSKSNSNSKQTKFFNPDFPTSFRIFEVKRKFSNLKLFNYSCWVGILLSRWRSKRLWAACCKQLAFLNLFRCKYFFNLDHMTFMRSHEKGVN